MTCLADRQYDLHAFHSIGCSIDPDAHINPEAVEMINKLALRVGAPEYQRTPTFQKRHHDHNRGRRRPQRQTITAADWQEMRNFKSQTLQKNEEGIEKEIDDLRLKLNRITATNYNELRDEIITLLQKILDSSPKEEELLKVGESIFEIGCLNKFWAKLYAELYKDLMGIFPVMNSIYKKNFETFLSLFDVIRFVPAEEDYDKFCEINKENQKRRAVSTFFVHLMRNGVLKEEKVLNIITTLKDKFTEAIETEGQRNEVDEIGENLCILISEGAEMLSAHEIWESVQEFIEAVADMKHNDHASLTSKIVFKFMDLCDE